MKKILLFLVIILPLCSYGQTQIYNNFKVNAPKDIDSRTGRWNGAAWVPYTTTSAANDSINSAYRYLGLTVRVGTPSAWDEYWYKGGVADSNLVVKMTGGGTTDSSIFATRRWVDSLTNGGDTDSSVYATKYYTDKKIDSVRMDYAVTQGYAATIDSNVQRSGIDSILKRGNVVTTGRPIEWVDDGMASIKIGSDPSKFPGGGYIKFGYFGGYDAKQITSISRDSVRTSYLALSAVSGGTKGLSILRNQANSGVNQTFYLPDGTTGGTLLKRGDNTTVFAQDTLIGTSPLLWVDTVNNNIKYKTISGSGVVTIGGGGGVPLAGSDIPATTGNTVWLDTVKNTINYFNKTDSSITKYQSIFTTSAKAKINPYVANYISAEEVLCGCVLPDSIQAPLNHLVYNLQKDTSVWNSIRRISPGYGTGRVNLKDKALYQGMAGVTPDGGGGFSIGTLPRISKYGYELDSSRSVMMFVGDSVSKNGVSIISYVSQAPSPSISLAPFSNNSANSFINYLSYSASGTIAGNIATGFSGSLPNAVIGINIVADSPSLTKQYYANDKSIYSDFFDYSSISIAGDTMYMPSYAALFSSSTNRVGTIAIQIEGNGWTSPQYAIIYNAIKVFIAETYREKDFYE